MTETPADQAAQELDAAAERASFTSARQHVGAAGFAQTNLLEQIISAAREQISVSHSLRQVVVATQAQLDDLDQTAAEPTEARQAHRAALESIVSSAEMQIEAADALRRITHQALSEVRATPLEEVSAGMLTSLSGVVRRQAAGLQAIIRVAIQQAGSPDQISQLERVGAEATHKSETMRRETAERELAHLELLGTQALQRIRSLEDTGEAHAAQKKHLQREAERSARRIAALELEEAQNVAEIDRLGEQAAAATVRQAALREEVRVSRTQLAELSAQDQRPGQTPDPDEEP